MLTRFADIGALTIWEALHWDSSRLRSPDTRLNDHEVPVLKLNINPDISDVLFSVPLLLCGWVLKLPSVYRLMKNRLGKGHTWVWRLINKTLKTVAMLESDGAPA